MVPLLLALLLPVHTVGLSRGVYVVDGANIDIELTFARPEALALMPAIDVDGDALVGEAELAAAHVGLAEVVRRELRLRRDGRVCALELQSAGLVEGAGVTLALRASCPSGGSDVVVDFGLLSHLGAGHRHLGHVSAQGSEVDVVAFAGAPEFTLTGSASAPPVGAYLRLGVEHILLGFDHLVFVFGILVVLLRGGRARSLLTVITAFTLAHSVTLGLAATRVLVLPSSFVEPMIAASIVFVGIESFSAKDIARRWRVTLPFGLVHGFGFAGALAEIGLPQHARLWALGLFNVGVELGQLAVVLAIAPLLMLLRKHLAPRFINPLVWTLSGAVVVVGLYWLLQRL